MKLKRKHYKLRFAISYDMIGIYFNGKFQKSVDGKELRMLGRKKYKFSGWYIPDVF